MAVLLLVVVVRLYCRFLPFVVILRSSYVVVALRQCEISKILQMITRKIQ